jgi:hypothetical protein
MIVFTPTVGVSPGTTTMTLGAAPMQTFDPYGTGSRLRGLGQTTTTRWGLVVFAGLATFAAALGYGYYRNRKR